MHIYSIYKATNKVTGKCYIGFDSNWPRRKLEHKSSAKNKKHNFKFYRAIRKYGWDNFEWSIIYQSKDGEHCKCIMENYFITTFNSMKKGYNSTLGGEGQLGLKHNEKTKIKCGAHQIKINGITYNSKQEAMTKLNIGWRQIKRIEKNLPLGRTGQNNGKSKPIILFGKKYETKTEARKKLNLGTKKLNKLLNDQLDLNISL